MENSPKHQRALQRFMRMSPRQRAIFDAGLVHAGFADESMRRQLQGMRDAALNTERSENVSMGKERLGLARGRFALGQSQSAANLGLRERELQINERDRRGAEILGLGSAALDTIHGYQNMQNKIALAKKYRGLAPDIYKDL